MAQMQEPKEIDKIPYDAPLSFQEPSRGWSTKRGYANNRSKFIRDEDLPKVDLTGKWVVISGSNNGIGREAALDFARMGANLILACRKPPPKENDPESVVAECVTEAKKFKCDSIIEWWEYDAADLASAEAFAQRWLETGRALDILCNNAGIGSSPGGSEIWLTELQHRLLQHSEYKHITVNGLHPGYVNTGVWNLNKTDSWATWARQWVVKTMAYFRAITPQQGSLAIRYVATAPECGPDPKTQGVGDPEGKGGGRYFNRIWEEEAMPHCRDNDARLRVWRKVNEELKLDEKGLLDVLGLYSMD
ncbi:hypothetical protein B7463_g6773, partial [Scytalidium lignicola]